MMLLEKHLEIKQSKIPGAGMGLFTNKPIKKETIIVEYTGTITTWKEVDHDEGTNVYIYYVSRNHVIDARHHKDSLARYVNDARGMQKIKGLRNNTQYVKIKRKIYLQAIANIPAGAEIMVSYGKEYWDVIKRNKDLDRMQMQNLAVAI
ncbi:hypothetical protein BH11BAC3_BH11BAC3_18350 [soil metagenome]